ncbi:hypothetical protein PLESTB_001326200 [Pleodorina starrii]|uniref:phytol kinase n=1 Tax=Pleodorina starrii TaxID=330485 RepID=A0A9W6F6D6_9CHLO|nr:hypothetical protein PLESTB_001326200 [Pleodorina starrii]
MAADLFAMLAVALRRSSPAAQDVDEAARELYQSLRRGLSHFISDAMNVQGRKVQMLLASLLLRTEVLRCYAMLLRCAGRQLQQHSTSSSNVATTEALLSEVNGLLQALDSAASEVAGVKGEGPSADPRIQGPGAMTAEQFLRTLSAEFRASSLLDAWATCFLQLRGCASSDINQAARLLCAFTTAVQRYNTWFGPDSDLAFCAGAATDTGLHFLLAAHVVDLAEAIDGGTRYGLPEDAPLLALAQAPDEDDEAEPRASSASGAIFLGTSLLTVAIQWWSYFGRGGGAAAAAAFPPWNNAATFDICIRLVHAAVAAARPRNRVRDVGRSWEPGAVRLARSGSGDVAMLALKCAESALRGIISRRSLRPRGGGGGSLPVRPADVERLRALWTAYMSAVDAFVESIRAGGGDAADGSYDSAVGDYWHGFIPFIIPDIMPTGHCTAGTSACPPLPSALGVEAEVVLSAGVLACMERLMRVPVLCASTICGAESHRRRNAAPGEAQPRASSASASSSGVIFLDTSLLSVALQWWSYFGRGGGAAAAAAFPPWNNAATFDICIRLVHAAVAAAAARPRDRVRDVGRDVGRGREPGAVRLARSGSGGVALLALLSAAVALRGIISRRSLCPRGGGGGSLPVRPADVERLRALWTAYMSAVDASVESVRAGPYGGGDAADGRENSEVGDYWPGFAVFTIRDLLRTGHSTAGLPLPSELGVEAEVVLSAGVLACMERLMRVPVVCPFPLCGAESWIQILMFGPVSELAAMIATTAKGARGLLQSLQKAEWEGRLEPETKDDPAMCRATVIADVISLATKFLEAAMIWACCDQLAAALLAGSGGAGGGEAGGGGRRPDQGDGAGGTCSEGVAAGESSRGGGSAAGGSSTGSTGGGSAADGSGRSSSQVEAAGVQQLLDLTSFAIIRLLPATSRVLQHFHLPALDRLRGLEMLTPSVFGALQTALQACLLVLQAAAAAEDAVAPGSGGGRGGGGAANSPSHPHAGAGGAQSAAAKMAAAAQWRRLLLAEVGAVELLGAAARALSCRRRHQQETTEGASCVHECGDAFGSVLCLMCAAFPGEMRAALGGGSGHSGGRNDSAAASMNGATEPSSSAAAQRRACLTLPVIARLLGPNGDFPNPMALDAVRTLMKGDAAPRTVQICGAAAAVAAALPPPDEVRRRMAPYCCANAACANLDGPSELALPRRRCGGGCGGAVWWYCSRECQVAHWRAGHKAECEAAGAGAGACGGQGGHAGTVGARG